MHLLCSRVWSGDLRRALYLSVVLGVTVQTKFILFGRIFAFGSSTGTENSSASPKTLGTKYSGRFLSQKLEEFQIGKHFSSSKTQTNLNSYTFAV